MPTESRLHVAQTLHGVFGQGSRIPDTWDSDLSSDDAAFAQALLGLCLRRWGRLQAYVRTKLSDPARSIPLGSQIALAMGLAQLAWLGGVTDHAAVNESVELTADRTLGFPPHKGLSNAILRAAARDREALRQALDGLPAALDRTPFAERVLDAALAPRNEAHRREELWAKLQEPPQPYFRAVKSGPLPDGLIPAPEVPGALQLATGHPFPRAWLMEGRGMVQDLSSQALMTFRWEKPVRRVADVCAAPGGKTTALALRWPEAELYAVEQHPRRAKRLRENLQARGVAATIVVEDAVPWLARQEQSFDLIHIDAPCSGSGTLRKHPELVWLGDTLDMEHLETQQRALLLAALPRLAPGGLLLYSVCSWLPEEGQHHHAAIMKAHPNVSSILLWPENLQAAPDLFQPPPWQWEGEGFQGFALTF